MDKIKYKCKKCGKEWKAKPPLFTNLHACKVQGCKGTAYPQEKNVSPSGVEELEE